MGSTLGIQICSYFDLETAQLLRRKVRSGQQSRFVRQAVKAALQRAGRIEDVDHLLEDALRARLARMAAFHRKHPEHALVNDDFLRGLREDFSLHLAKADIEHLVLHVDELEVGFLELIRAGMTA